MSLFKQELELKVQEAEYEIGQQLDRFPPWKKWSLIALAALAIPVYIAARTISFNRWQQKLAPLIVSAKDSFQNPKALENSPVQFVNNGNGTYSALLTLTNPNLDLSAHDVPVEVDFFNANNEQIGVPFRDTIFILPNSTKYLAITRLPAQQVARANIILPPEVKWQRRLYIPPVNLKVASPVVSESTNAPGTVVTVPVKNLSPYDIGTIKMIFLVYNSSNQLIALSQREESNVASNSVRDFIQTWPNLGFPKDAVVKAVVETNTLDAKNLLVPKDSAKGSASDLSRPETGR